MGPGASARRSLARWLHSALCLADRRGAVARTGEAGRAGASLARCSWRRMSTLALTTLLLLGTQSDAPLAPPKSAVSAPPAAVAAAPEAHPPPTGQAERIAIELLVAGAAGLGAGAFGGYLGCLASPSPNGQSCSTSTVAAVGLTTFGLTVGAVVPLVGNALGGDGLLWVSWLAEAAGLGGGLALAQGNPTNAMYFAAPLMLVGAIAGYELTTGRGPPPKDDAGVRAVSVAPLPSGAALAVVGRF